LVVLAVGPFGLEPALEHAVEHIDLSRFVIRRIIASFNATTFPNLT
jgi:hypothetical protein